MKTLENSAIYPDQDAAVARSDISLAGSQFLARFPAALCFMGILLWAVLKLWLFEQ
jgi:hypothetical protein